MCVHILDDTSFETTLEGRQFENDVFKVLCSSVYISQVCSDPILAAFVMGHSADRCAKTDPVNKVSDRSIVN